MEIAPRPDIPFKYSLARLEKEFVRTGNAQGWMHTDTPLLLAVSGGSDSVAMLWLFSLFRNKNLVVAHLDHGIRGEEGKGDASFVASLSPGSGSGASVNPFLFPPFFKKANPSKTAHEESGTVSWKRPQRRRAPGALECPYER